MQKLAAYLEAKAASWGDLFFFSLSVWPDLAKLYHFGTLFKVLGKFVRVYLKFAKFLSYFGKNVILLGKFSLFERPKK